jgi:hypothetical protein
MPQLRPNKIVLLYFRGFWRFVWAINMRSKRELMLNYFWTVGYGQTGVVAYLREQSPASERKWMNVSEIYLQNY